MTKSKRTTTRADDLFITCDILQSIAESYPARSRERKAVRDAAEALVFMTMHEQLNTSYDKFRRSTKRGLTRAQEQTLRSMGIKP
jgi:hypothetical protein